MYYALGYFFGSFMMFIKNNLKQKIVIFIIDIITIFFFLGLIIFDLNNINFMIAFSIFYISLLTSSEVKNYCYQKNHNNNIQKAMAKIEIVIQTSGFCAAILLLFLSSLSIHKILVLCFFFFLINIVVFGTGELACQYLQKT